MVIVRFARVWRAVLRMGHPLVRWSLQVMTQDGGTTAQLQGDHERCRGSTTKLSGMWRGPLAQTAQPLGELHPGAGVIDRPDPVQDELTRGAITPTAFGDLEDRVEET